MEVHNFPERSVSGTRRKKKTANVGTKNEQHVVQLTSQGSFEENKILNTSDNKNVFLATSEIFENVLNQLIIDNDKEVHETLLRLKDVIQAKLLNFKCSSKDRYESEDDALSVNSLTSCKSLASSTLSLCSQKSFSANFFAGNKAYQKFCRKVNCPFCFKSQEDKINLIKHLDENCQPLINNEFEERNFIPFSAFQILPNNTIKCNICHNLVLKNLKHFFVHMGNKFHKSEYAKAEKIKKYTEFLFCSCCKILIPNNYTQLDFHMNHKTHKSKSNVVPLSSELFKNADCVYLKSKKFKCLICPSRAVYQNVKDILEHFENQSHGIKLRNGMFRKAFCEFCMEDVNIFDILSHLSSHDHILKEKSSPLQEWYETCYYCGFVCSNLKELSVHMITKCKEITNIREESLKAEKLCKKNIKNESKEKKSETSVSKNNMPTKGITSDLENIKQGLHVIVKDTTDVLEVYKYFKKFGEITRVEIYKEKNVVIEFRDTSAVEDALLLRDVIHINGVKMEITTDEVPTKPVNAVKKLEKGIDSNEEHLLETSDDSQSYDSESSDEFGPPVPNSKLEDLFQRVSRHLANTTKTYVTAPK